MFEFKEGDYIVWNKLSPWQKSHIAVTLPFVENGWESLKHLRGDKLGGIVFLEDWTWGNQKSFGSCDITDYECKRELSFNEIFGEEDDTCPANKHPLWVTFDAEQDWDESCNLIDGKDYKVLEATHGGDCYTVLDESGYERSYNKRFFDKPVSIASCKKSPTPCEEDECGFEGLVYVTPNVRADYIVIDSRKLSKEQLDFIKGCLDVESPEELDDETLSWDYKFLNYCVNDDKWFVYSKNEHDIELSFNNIFKYKDEV